MNEVVTWKGGCGICLRLETRKEPGCCPTWDNCVYKTARKEQTTRNRECKTKAPRQPELRFLDYDKQRQRWSKEFLVSDFRSNNLSKKKKKKEKKKYKLFLHYLPSLPILNRGLDLELNYLIKISFNQHGKKNPQIDKYVYNLLID